MTKTTTTSRKIATRKRGFLPALPKKPYTRRELVAEFVRLTGEPQDGAYLADLVSGARLNKRIGEKAKEAAANLTAKAQVA